MAMVEFEVAHKNVITVEGNVTDVATEWRPVEGGRGLVVVIGWSRRGIGRGSRLAGLQSLGVLLKCPRRCYNRERFEGD